MKKIRTITIKDSRLKKIRNNLRLLLFEALNTELQKYFVEQRRLNRDLYGNFKKMSKLEKQRAGELTRKMRKITIFLEKSIIQCAACRKIDQDMTYNLVLKQWYCTECYKDMCELYYEWQRKEGRAKKLEFDDFNEEFYKTFLY